MPSLAPSPASPWAGRTHDELAELTRELLLAGHLIDRAGMPLLVEQYGMEGMRDTAIAEWMGASPIYTKRMQQLLGFEGDDVETIFKGMQFDIGAPPEFMDFRYRVHDATHGEFWLDHCGALMDVEPMGEEFVFAMCHDIEDPTFDATAVATNARAQVRPIHRPPRTPADRHPHCAWTVTIVADADPLPTPREAELVGASQAAAVPLATPAPGLATDDGDDRYDGPVEPDLVVERFSSATLSAVLDEVALQGHLLSRSYLLQVADRSGGDLAAALGIRQAAGVGGVATKRLAAALGLPTDLDGLAAVLAVHPLLLPRSYVDVRLGRAGDGPDDHLTLALGPCPALDEPDGLTWLALIAEHDAANAVLTSVTACLTPHAVVERAEPTGDAVAAWTIRVDTDAATPEPPEVELTEISTGAAFRFQRRGTPVAAPARRSPA
ncbi:MAG TPA: hypothetical protein VHA73_06345 [Acidimicrobiales bacterium]|jgi:hypothetical protein|nr:hypothetical protein [Acidimicrobiales bacterium]